MSGQQTYNPNYQQQQAYNLWLANKAERDKWRRYKTIGKIILVIIVLLLLYFYIIEPILSADFSIAGIFSSIGSGLGSIIGL